MSFVDDLRAATRRRKHSSAGPSLPAAVAASPVVEPEPEPTPAAVAERWAPHAPASSDPGPEPVEPSPDLLPAARSARWLVDPSTPPAAVAWLAPAPSRRRWRPIAAVIALLVVAGVAAFFLLKHDDAGAPPAAQRADAAVRLVSGIPQVGALLGTDKEVPTLTVFADIASSDLARFDRDVLPTLVSDYVRPGRLKIRLRILPDARGASRTAARYAQAAGLQTKLWQYVRALESLTDGDPSNEDLRLAAIAAGLDGDRLLTDSRSRRVRRAIARDVALGADQHLARLPAFTLFDGSTTRDLAAPLSAHGFAKALDAVLRPESGKRRGA